MTNEMFIERVNEDAELFEDFRHDAYEDVCRLADRWLSFLNDRTSIDAVETILHDIGHACEVLRRYYIEYGRATEACSLKKAAERIVDE